MKEIRAFNIRIHPLCRTEFLSIIKSNLKDGNQVVQIGVNSASINGLVKNGDFRRAVNNADLVNVDGVSVVWALRFLGYKVPERVATPDLADDILSMAQKEGYSIFLLGAKDSILFSCKKNLEAAYPKLKIAGYRNGYFKAEEESLIVDSINEVKPDILFLGMPSPQKELFFEKYRHSLTARYILGVGGYFDIISGFTKRAPPWVQKIGMEWFHRFIQEPGRMWHRYMVGTSKFLGLVIKEKFRGNGLSANQ